MTQEQRVLRDVERFGEIDSDLEDEPYDVAELIPHPRQMTIYDVLTAEDLRNYLTGARA